MVNAGSVIPRTIAAPAAMQIDPRAAALPGQALADVGDAGAKFAEAQIRARDEASLVSARLTAAQQLDDLHQKYRTDPDPATALQRFQADADKLGETLASKIQIPANQTAFSNDIGQMIEGRRVALKDVYFERETASAVADLNASQETLSRQAAYASNKVERQASIDAYSKSVKGLVDRGMLNPEIAQKNVQGFSEKLALYDGRQLVTRDPASAAKHLANPKFLPELDPLARVELQSQAETELRVREREARAAAAEARANAREALADFNSITSSGLPPSQDVLDQTRAAVRASGDPRIAEHFARSIQAAGFASQLRGATPHEVEGAINAIDTKAAASGVDQSLAAAEKGARAYLAKMNHGLAQDPLDWASKQGVVTIKPLALNGTDSARDWQLRTRAAELAAQHYGTKPRYLTQDEIHTLGTQLDMSQPADKRLAAVHMLVNNLGSRAVPVLADLAATPHQGRSFGGSEHFDALGAMATAGGLLADGPAYVPVARDIANGEAALKARPELSPHIEKFTGSGDVTLGNLRLAFSAMPQEYNRVVTAAKAIYAKRAGDAGLIGSDVAAKGNTAFAAALDAATGAHYVQGQKFGGLALYNGAPVLAPNNVAADGFEDLAHQLTAKDLARASVTGAKPVVEGKDVDDDVIRNSYLVSAGSNRYAISTTDPSRGQVTPLRDAKGAIYRLDFEKALTLLQARGK